MTKIEYDYWESFIAAIPAAQSRFIGVKFVEDTLQPDFIPNFNTLFNQFLRENEHMIRAKNKDYLKNSTKIVAEAMWFKQYYNDCYVNFDDDII